MTQPPFGDARPVAPTFTVGEALSFGWSRFSKNPLSWIGMVILTGAVPVLASYLGLGDYLQSVLDAAANGETLDAVEPLGMREYLLILATIVATLILQAAVVRGALDEVNGRKPGFSDFFNLPNVGQILLTGLIVAVLTVFGFVIFIIPGLIVFFLSYLATHFVVDMRSPAISGIKRSWSVVSKNVGPLLALALTAFVLNVIGALLFGLGTLVTMPVTAIAVAYGYRTLSGGYVKAA